MFKKLTFVSFFLLLSISLFAQNPLKLKYFVSGTDLTIKLRTQGAYNYTFVKSNNASVTGYGSVSSNFTEISVPEIGTYILSIQPTGVFRFSQSSSSSQDNYRSKFIEITQWGDITWNTNLSYMFEKWSNLQITATDLPNFSNVTNMSNMFSNCTTLSIVNNINNWDVSNVTNMSNMFKDAIAFNINISNWNVSNVISMSNMFNSAKLFNQNIGNWNVSNVTTMESMFESANQFNQNISTWNVSQVTIMQEMFSNGWAFNQNIGSWNVSNVTSMRAMFINANSFNQNITNWNTSNVSDFSFMFDGTNFNQNISSWNVSNALTMVAMFQNTNSFNQNLGTWELSPIVNLGAIFGNSALSCGNLGATLKGWAENPNTPFFRSIGMHNSTLGTGGQLYKNQLIDSKGWTFSGNITYDASCAESFLEIKDLNFRNNKIIIYPNPAKEKIVIKANQKPSKIQVSDALGKMVLNTENVEEIDVAHLSSGIYFVTVTLEDGFISSHKLIKQ